MIYIEFERFEYRYTFDWISYDCVEILFNNNLKLKYPSNQLPTTNTMLFNNLTN